MADTTIISNLPEKIDVNSSDVFIVEDNQSTQKVTKENLLKGLATKEELEEVKQSVSNGKQLLADALTDMGIPTSANETFESMANKILQLNKVQQSTGLATRDDINLITRDNKNLIIR